MSQLSQIIKRSIGREIQEEEIFKVWNFFSLPLFCFFRKIVSFHVTSFRLSNKHWIKRISFRIAEGNNERKRTIKNQIKYLLKERNKEDWLSKKTSTPVCINKCLLLTTRVIFERRNFSTGSESRWSNGWKTNVKKC